MTPAQLVILKTDMQLPANASALSAMIDAEDWPGIAAWYNTPVSPPVLLWRPQVPVSEMANMVVWADFAALTTLKQTTYLGLTQGGVINATLASVRSAFVAIFGAGSATTTALTALAQRAGTHFETLFASGGVSSVFGQVLDAGDVQQAMLLP